MNEIDLSIAALHGKYRSGGLAPGDVVDYILAKAEAFRDHAIWITRLSRQEIQPYLDRLSQDSPESLPFYGIPFAIKDNFDLAGTPTTAACPAYAHVPSESAFAVQCLLDAGAIPIGKTNMDQFATGLSGSRSPYGVVKNAINPAYIAGGSSSGSAVAVALGLSSFALGTDTAGSVRVPAMFNRLVGVKPSRGIISTRGIVPACRSLDCAGILALNPDDAARLYEVLAVYDELDPYARRVISGNAPSSRRFGIIPPDQLEVFGNGPVRVLMDAAVENLVQIGFTPVEIDYEPFRQAADLLYEGPWLAERYAAIEQLITTHPELLHPITRAVIEPGGRISAVDAFKAMYRLQALKKHADAQFAGVDFILTPTAATIYTTQEMEQDPLELNSRLGYYTNFMNLLDYAAVAVPAGSFPNGLPFGVTLFSSTYSDRYLLELSQRLIG